MRDSDKQSLVDRYIDLYAIAFALMHNEEDARDAVQEALAVTMAFPILHNPFQFCTKVLRNICFKHLKKNYTLVASLPQTADVPPDIEREERLLRLEQARHSLPAETLRILDMHFVDGLSLKEIANTTGRSLPSLKKQFSQTYIKLRTEMYNLETKQKDLS